MLKIGDFSKLSRLSVRMLRHYDELGLLTPLSTDPFTGYRYYAEEQLAAAAHIVGVQDVKAQDLPVLFADAGKALGLEKFQAALPVQLLHLGESHPGFHHFIPYPVGGIDIRRCKGSDVHCHSPFILSVRLPID